MDEHPGEEKLEEAQKSLYLRQGFRPNIHRSAFTKEKIEAPDQWKDMPKPKKPFPVLRTLFMVSLLFFAAAVVVAGVLFTTGQNTISPDNIEINVDGPVAVKGGEEAVFKITLVNKNGVPLESSNLQINYPPGTRSSTDLAQELSRERKHLGTIEPGEIINETARAVLFGAENSKQDIRIALEYRTAGSNAIFEKEKIVTVTLTSSPIGVVVDVPEAVSVGQDITAKVTITSNSTKVLEGMYLLVTVPGGFVLKSTEPAPKSGLLWQLGDIAPGTSRSFVIRGTVGGALNETSGFSATVGSLNKITQKTIEVPYGTAFEAFQIQKSAVELSVAINGTTDTTVIANPGDRMRADLTWVNNLSVSVRNAELKVKLSGPMLNQAKVSTANGFYNSADNTITFRPQDIPELALLDPGEEAHTNFTFTLQERDYIESRGLVNPTLDMEATLTGERASDVSAVDPVSSRLVRTIKVNSTVGLISDMSYSAGPFRNTGPMPPKVGQETTYTVFWRIYSLSSGLRNARVVAILPTYVKWLGVKSPSGEQLSYNPLTGEVTWNAGNVGEKAGYAEAPRTVYFQVAMTPSLSQKDSSPNLLEESKFSATDLFTGFLHQGDADAVTTSSFDTSGVRAGDVE